MQSMLNLNLTYLNVWLGGGVFTLNKWFYRNKLLQENSSFVRTYIVKYFVYNKYLNIFHR